LTLDVLGKLVNQGNFDLQLEAARALAGHPQAKRIPLLIDVARNDKIHETVRAQAIAGLADNPKEALGDLLAWTAKGDAVLRDEALRALVNAPLGAQHKTQLDELARSEPATRDLVARLMGKAVAQGRPPAKDLDAWLKRLEGPADAAAGRRIFAHPRLATCARCHRMEGRGNDVGPDLSTIGRTERRHILESILQPSNLVAPSYQAWLVETADGRVRTGMLTGTYLDEYTYLDEKGGQFKVNTREVIATRPAATSIMPDGLVDQLTDQELRDLLAYLCSRH
jgi:putative heme-binding domain-containing protein